ncbi:hypothetical protein BVZ63_107 [Haemophilus influenzae]|nr:hypothetical protein BVZ63_107 [Haemophilus influenzae]
MPLILESGSVIIIPCLFHAKSCLKDKIHYFSIYYLLFNFLA